MHRTVMGTLAGMCGLATTLAVCAPAQAGSFKLLYSFKGGATDGANPQADLIVAGGKLFGTTYSGGSANAGTVFSLDPKTGVEKILHSFMGGADGLAPAAGLLKVGRTLYGTTTGGGSAQQGTVFSLDLATGTETVLHSFQGGANDGAYPQSRLIDVGGRLYGTTMQGASANCDLFGCGTVFSIDPATGTKKIVHFFQGGNDGAFPAAGLIKQGALLYGTTLSGGAGDCGTVFSLNPANGTEHILHEFNHQGDGTNPVSGLINGGGALYGTTVAGGISGDGLGVVYAYNLKGGAEQALHLFIGADGALPEGGVVQIGGKLYGTTSLGAKPNDGVIFSLDPVTGAETVLHVFKGSDGANPWAGLVITATTLYGTASGGGAAGAGVVFSFSP